MLGAGRQVYSELKNLCVWNKTNAGMGSFYRSKHELVFVWKSGTAAHINNFELGQHGRHRNERLGLRRRQHHAGGTAGRTGHAPDRQAGRTWSPTRSRIARAVAAWCSIRSAAAAPS